MIIPVPMKPAVIANIIKFQQVWFYFYLSFYKPLYDVECFWHVNEDNVGVCYIKAGFCGGYNDPIRCDSDYNNIATGWIYFY
jgi:hypothetical protein